MFESQQFGALYAAGGLADQPAGLVRRMRAAYNTWEAVSAWRAAKIKATWCEKNQEEWKIVKMVIKLREESSSDKFDKGK
jgi:hypothetical protein